MDMGIIGHKSNCYYTLGIRGKKGPMCIFYYLDERSCYQSVCFYVKKKKKMCVIYSFTVDVSRVVMFNGIYVIRDLV